MANVRVERGKFYLGALLIAELSEGKMEKTSGDEQHDGTDGAIYFSTGNGRVVASGTNIVPKIGMKAQIEAAVDNHTDVTMTFVMNGHAQKSDGRLVSISFDSDAKSGMLKGAWSFTGGPAVNV